LVHLVLGGTLSFGNIYFILASSKKKIINYGFEIFNSRDLGMIFKDLRFRDLEILDSS